MGQGGFRRVGGAEARGDARVPRRRARVAAVATVAAGAAAAQVVRAAPRPRALPPAAAALARVLRPLAAPPRLVHRLHCAAGEVVRDVLLHAGVGAPLADRAAARVAPPRADQRNARATGRACRAAGTTSCSRCTRRLSSGSTPSSPHAPSPSRRATTAARASSTRRRPPTRRRRRAARRRAAAAGGAAAGGGKAGKRGGRRGTRHDGSAARPRAAGQRERRWPSRAFCPGSCAVAVQGRSTSSRTLGSW